MIQITEKASDHIKRIMKDEGHEAEAFLRVKVQKGGCSGWSYKLDFDNQTGDKDKVFESFDTRVVVDSESLLYLLGMTLDYEGGLNGQGFVFSNPNATKTCGCGSSFGV
ncbi:MAG: iron-sulfur cluster assembly accessory protein [Bdellovibrionales bacterium]|nr:iron-sulfur cluster assembly accessory protein [Bdellovibrionales bacterium]